MRSYTVSLLLLLMLNWAKSEGASDRICSRIFMGSKVDRYPYANLLNGVYVKTDKVVDKFPVYVYERGGAYFQYSSAEGVFYFSTHGMGYKNYAGVFAQSDTYLMQDPQRWVNRVNNKTNLFGSALKDWYMTNPSTEKEEKSYWIYPMCVESNFTDCRMGDLEFLINVTNSAGGKPVNDPNTDYFRPIPNKFLEFRPVYKHSNFAVSGWYLYYYVDRINRGRWMIGPDYTKSNRYWDVFDEAYKAEFVTSNWRQWNGRTFVPFDKSVKLQCRGIAGVRCKDKPCSVCSEDFSGRAFCTCPMGLTGNYCLTEQWSCDKTTTRTSMQVNSAYGSVATKICKRGGFKTITCQRDAASGSLQWVGDYCPGAPRPRPSPTPKPFNFEDVGNEGWKWTMVFSALFLPFLLPLIHWGIAKCRGKKKGFLRLLSIYTYVSAYLDIVYIILYHKDYFKPYGDSTFHIMNIFALVSLAACYVASLVESVQSHEKDYLTESIDTDDINSYISSLVQTKPTLLTEVRCWHSETHYRTVTYTDSQGFSRSRQEAYQEAVTTWRGSEAYEYSSWIDLTNRRAMPKIDESRMTRLKLNVDIRFKDEPTRLDFLVKQKLYVDSNRWRDTSTNFETKQQIEGLIERSTLFGKNYTKPCWLNKTCYWLTVALFMTWPYRILLRLHSKQVELTFVKEISCTDICAPTAPSLTQDSEKKQLHSVPEYSYGSTNAGYATFDM